MCSDVGNSALIRRLYDLVAVDTHVGVIGVGEQANDSGFFGNHAMTQFVFEVLRMRLPRLPDEVDAVGDLRHQGFAETKSPVSIFVVGGKSDGISASVSGVVVGTVVVGGPVEELQVRIGADGIHIEE